MILKDLFQGGEMQRKLANESLLNFLYLLEDTKPWGCELGFQIILCVEVWHENCGSSKHVV